MNQMEQQNQKEALFWPSKDEKMVAFLMYVLAYLYWSITNDSIALIAFVLLFVGMTEFLFRKRERRTESLIWLFCLLMITIGMATGRATDVWGMTNAKMFLHVFAVWWVLSRSNCLLERESGHFFFFDALNGFFVFPFTYFFYRIKTVGKTISDLQGNGEKKKTKTILWIIMACILAGVLFVIASILLSLVDDVFGELMVGILERISFISIPTFFFRFLFSLPVGAYLFGLLIGGLRYDRKKLDERTMHYHSILARLRNVPNLVWVLLISVFCLLYGVFFILQKRYLFGAFSFRVPEGLILSEYARRGFFELCLVITINFILLWLMTRLSMKPVRESKASMIVCTILIMESLLFSIIAFSKLALYIYSFGFTPLRIQSTWLIILLAVGCICSLFSLFTGKKSFRFWMCLSAISLSLLHIF